MRIVHGILILCISAMFLAAIATRPNLNFYLLTGKLWPIRIIERLENPVSVRGWNSDGLLLVDGRTIPVPDVKSLPIECPALAEATRHGVEISRDGTAVGAGSSASLVWQ